MKNCPTCVAACADNAKECPTCGHAFNPGRAEELMGAALSCVGIVLATAELPLAPAVFFTGLVVFIIGRFRA